MQNQVNYQGNQGNDNHKVKIGITLVKAGDYEEANAGHPGIFFFHLGGAVKVFTLQ